MSKRFVPYLLNGRLIWDVVKWVWVQYLDYVVWKW